MARSWEPGPEIQRWQERISRLLGEGLQQLSAWSQGARSVPVNVFETEHCLEAVFAMPALRKDEIDVSYEGDTLTVRAATRHDVDQDRRYIHREWGYGPYVRALVLPEPVDFDRATASYDNGVLIVIMPKLPAGSRQVPVTGETAQSQGGS